MIREWEKLEYHDPEHILKGFREIAINLPLDTLPYSTASLRDRELRIYGESRQCALFCYGMSKVLGVKVLYAHHEDSDYDFISFRVQNGTPYYTPVQMKELVPKHINPTTSLEHEINKLKKYSVSNNLVVAMHMNRAGSFNLHEIKIPKLNFPALYFFGAKDSTQEKWHLIGNMLNNPKCHEFEYPKN